MFFPEFWESLRKINQAQEICGWLASRWEGQVSQPRAGAWRQKLVRDPKLSVCEVSRHPQVAAELNLILDI